MWKTSFILVFLLCFAPSAFGQDPSEEEILKQLPKKEEALYTSEEAEKKSLKQFGRWFVYKTSSHTTGQVCHAIARTVKTLVFEGVRDAPLLMLHQIHGNAFAVSVRPGFRLASHSDVALTIGRASYGLKVGTELYAWTYSAQQDRSLINAMLSSEGVVKTYSTSDTDQKAVDIYSLEGLFDALRYIMNECQTPQ
jgi:hypothetical protein